MDKETLAEKKISRYVFHDAADIILNSGLELDENATVQEVLDLAEKIKSSKK